MTVADKKTRKRLAILEVLRVADSPLSSTRIAEILIDQGYDISERTIRLYLQQLDQECLTRNEGKRGRRITDAGRSELGASTLLQRVGYLSTRIDQMTYRMNFDLALRSGTVIVNTTVVHPDDLLRYWATMGRVFELGYAMGTLVGLVRAHDSDTGIGIEVPDGMIGLCTVCSVTLNGVLLKHGVPTRSIFCGLLELVQGEATRFTELINYDGTTLDPLEVFIRSGMTNYTQAVTSGNGCIGAGFREVPADSYELVRNLADKLDRIGLGAFLRIGRPGQTLFNIPVREGACGAVVIGGLNPVAILEEDGHRVQGRALSGLMEFNRLFPFHELPERL